MCIKLYFIICKQGNLLSWKILILTVTSCLIKRVHHSFLWVCFAQSIIFCVVFCRLLTSGLIKRVQHLFFCGFMLHYLQLSVQCFVDSCCTIFSCLCSVLWIHVALSLVVCVVFCRFMLYYLQLSVVFCRFMLYYLQLSVQCFVDSCCTIFSCLCSVLQIVLCPFVTFLTLYCLSFDLLLLITNLVSLNFSY